jgi:hypothetical protein
MSHLARALESLSELKSDLDRIEDEKEAARLFWLRKQLGDSVRVLKLMVNTRPQ